ADAANFNIVGVYGSEGPSRGVLDVHAIDLQPLAVDELEHRAGTATLFWRHRKRGNIGPLFLGRQWCTAGGLPEARSLPIDSSRAGKGHVVCILRKDQVSRVVARIGRRPVFGVIVIDRRATKKR